MSIEEAFAEVVRFLGRCMAEEMRGADMISQRDPRGLGPRRHREAVKRRLRDREGGALIRGRDHLLTNEALLEEYQRGGPPSPGTCADGSNRRGGPGLNKARSPELETLRRELERDLRALRK